MLCLDMYKKFGGNGGQGYTKIENACQFVAPHARLEPNLNALAEFLRCSSPLFRPATAMVSFACRLLLYVVQSAVQI